MNDSRKRKKSESSSGGTKTKRKANRVGKKGDDEIISSFIEIMEGKSTKNSTPSYHIALGQFLCCAAREIKSIQTLERLLDSTNLPAKDLDTPTKCFVVEGIIRVCLSTLNIALAVRSYDVALKVSKILCTLLCLPIFEEDGERVRKTYDSPLNVQFTMNDKERMRIRNASNEMQTWDHERLRFIDATALRTSMHARDVLDTNVFATNILNGSEKLVQEYLKSRTKERSRIIKLASILLHILRYVRSGAQNQHRLAVLHDDENDDEVNNSDVHHRACAFMIRILQDTCERPNLVDSFDLVERMIRDSIDIASSNYDFVNQNLSIFASFSILIQVSSSITSLKNESRVVENILIFALTLLRETVFETAQVMSGIPRFVAFETLRDLCVNGKDEKITIRSSEAKKNTLGNVISRQNFLELLITLLSYDDTSDHKLVKEIATFIRFAKCSKIFKTHFQSHLNTSHVSTLLRRMRKEDLETRDIVLTMLHVDAFDVNLTRYTVEECFRSEPLNLSTCTLHIVRAILMKRNDEDEHDDSLQHRVCSQCIESLKSSLVHSKYSALSNLEQCVSLIEFAFVSCKATSQLELTKGLFDMISKARSASASSASTSYWCISLRLANMFCTSCLSAKHENANSIHSYHKKMIEYTHSTTTSILLTHVSRQVLILTSLQRS